MRSSFFFSSRRRHTRFSRDWSSDVCSSDLIVIVWFGFSLTAVTFVIVYTIVFPLVLSIVAGIEQVPQELVRAARSLGASRLRIFVEVILPGALPSVASGVRTGLGYGWRALVAAEIIVGTSGIGFMILTDHLRAALTSRSVIDQAIGIVMARERCSADEAFDVLRRGSQQRNTKLRDVAADLVSAVAKPPGGGRPVPPGN